jgi:CHAT domain-containing protein/Tfp pilus assembly protein PilF
MRAVVRFVFVLTLWIGLSGSWPADSAWAQQDQLEEIRRLQDRIGQLYHQGRYSEAIPLAQKQLNILEEALGPDHPNVAASLNNLALLYRDMGNYAAAEPLYKRSLAIGEKALGPGHRDVAASLNNLALLYRDMGNYAAAEPLHKRSLAIWEKTLGPDHPNVATSLNNLAELYRDMGNYAAAEPLHKRSLAIWEKALGPGHRDVAASLNNLAGLYRDMGNYAGAEPLYKRSLAIREKTLGPDHPNVATSLNNLAGLYRDMGNYAGAEPLHKRSLAIREKALGPEHPNVANSLNNLAGLYSDMGNYAAAEPLYKRSLAIWEKTLGPDHPDVAASLNGLAGLYRDMGNYAAAEPLYKRSLAIREKTLGPDHPDVAASLNNLAGLYRDMGNYAGAEPLYKRSLAIDEKALGPDHPDVASSLNNLAELYRDMGNYAAAEPLYKRSLAIREKALGPGHRDVAASLNNLALLYRDMGNYAAAEPLFKRTLTIQERALGTEHPDVATSLNNLAVLYSDMGNHAAAEPLYKRSLAIREKALGPDHPDVAGSLNNLAGLYRDMGNYAAAEPLYKRSLAIGEKALGPGHPILATSLNNLAGLYRTMGNYPGAEPLYKRSLAIREKALGPDHPDVASSSQNLAALKAAQGDIRQSLELMIRSQDIHEGIIEQIAGFTSGERTMQYLNTIQGGIHFCLSLVNLRIKKDASARKEAFGVWLRRKGVVLETQRRMQEALLEAGDEEAAKVFGELSLTRTRLAEMTFAGPGKEGAEAYRKRLKELNAQREELESKLSRLSQPYAKARKARKVTPDEVAKVLPKGRVLVDFARIKIFNFEAKGKEEKWLPARYLAFVLRPGQAQDVALLDLGPVEAIDNSLTQLKQAVTGQQAKARDLGRKLHDLVFVPIEKELGGAKLVFISPDGSLNLLPFEILRDPEGKYLIEKYTFNYLAAGRDLVGFSENNPDARKPLLLGDPDFDLDSKKKGQALDRLGVRLDTSLASARSSEQGSLRFGRLPGTRKEVSAIGELLGKGKSEVFLGESALKEVLQARKAPRILHLATHGFFLRDQELSAMRQFRGVGGTDSFLSMDQTVASHPGPRVSIENPLLRSGIALAGANRSGSSGQGSDGIMTADEVLGLRLRGTELVVLSACETGLGEVKTGEGVFGLRRAFAQAGARSLVMSMWSVPDEPTKELMVEFYKNILSGKVDRCQALRQAALKMKQKYGDKPYYWGAFVFQGQAD